MGVCRRLAVLQASSNVLLTGSDKAISAFLDLLRPLRCHRSRKPRIARPARSNGALILRDVCSSMASPAAGGLAVRARPRRRRSSRRRPRPCIGSSNARCSPRLCITINVIMFTLRDPLAPTEPACRLFSAKPALVEPYGGRAVSRPSPLLPRRPLANSQRPDLHRRRQQHLDHRARRELRRAEEIRRTR